jgi:type II secretory pathway component GspD/PulD (secretin)
MIRSISLSLGLTLLVGSAAGAFAQSTQTDAAIQEAVRRQADTITLRQKLAAAQEAERRGDLNTAANLYETCYKFVQSIGANGIAAETTATVQGLANVRLTLAKLASARHELREADVQVTRVLKVDPKNAAAIEFNKANKKALADMAGLMPSQKMVDQVPGWVTNRIDNSTKIQDAKLLFENGKYDEADALLNEVMKAEPGNYAAAYYSSLIKEKRHSNAVLQREIQTKKRILEVEKAWEMPTTREALPVPNPYAETNLIYTSQQRQTIMTKLERIRLDSVFYDGLPLSEVIRNLSDESKRRDPDKRGINFIISPNADTANAAPAPLAGGGAGFNGAFGGPGSTAAAYGQAPTYDPNTGQMITAAPVAAEPVDMSGISIKINPPLSDVSLHDVLDIIVKVADRPIKYSVENYGILFTLRPQESTPLHTRTFKVDPNTFWMGLENVQGISFGDVQTSSGSGGGGSRGGGNSGGANGGSGSSLTVPRVSVASGGNNGGGRNGGGGGNVQGGGSLFGSGLGGQGAGGVGATGGGGNIQGGGGLSFITSPGGMAQVQAAVRSFFASVGIDFTQQGKSVFFNDRQGTLIVRATLQDLDIIEQAIQVLNIAPPQINIRAKFAEVGQNDTRAVGFDWYMGNYLLGNGRIGAQGGTAPSYSGAASAANPNGFFPGTSLENTIPSSPADQIITPGLRNAANAPAVATITGILTDPQFRVVLRMLEQRSGVELLSAPDVTTVSGRQAQLQVVDIRTIVTGTDLNQNSSTSGNNDSTGNNSGGGAVGSTLNYTTEPLPFGPVLDVVPYVSADGFTVQMVIIPTITEFVGYDDPGGFVPQAQSVSSTAGAGLPLTAQLPLPHFRVRQVTTTTVVWDGQTIVLGGLLSENVSKTKDKVPVLGDVPLIGRLFRSESNITEKKNLVIFVTPTIIDPAGNRVHTDDQLPFAHSAIPEQRPVVQANAGGSK